MTMTTSAVLTRRLYLFENHSHVFSGYVEQERSLGFLRVLVGRVWHRYGRWDLPAPEIVVTNEAYHFACGYSRISMARGDMTVRVALHEVTHCLGYGVPRRWHTSGFVERYLRLLVEYGDCDEGALTMDSVLFGLRH